MSKRNPQMSVNLNQDALVTAIENYVQSLMGISSGVHSVEFTAGRGDKGYSADVTLSLGDDTVGTTSEIVKPTGPTKRSAGISGSTEDTKRNKPGPKPKQKAEPEPAEEEEAPDADEADTASAGSDDEAMDAEEETPAKEAKSETKPKKNLFERTNS